MKRISLFLIIGLIAIFVPASALADADRTESQIQTAAALIQDAGGPLAQTQKDVEKVAPGGSSEVSVYGSRVLRGLAICVGIFLIGASLYRRLSGDAPRKGESRIHILERTSLSPKSSLVLLQVDGKKVLASVGSETVSFCSLEQNRQNESQPFSESLELVCNEA